MSRTEDTLAVGQDQAVRWALSRAGATAFETVSQSSWACTFRLTGPREDSYLKIVPPSQRPALRRVVAVSRAFDAHVPAVIAAEADEGWILTADHGGRTPLQDESNDEILDVARRYADMQCRAAASPALLACLEAVDPARTIDAFLAFLDGTAQAGAAPAVGAAYFVGAADAARYARLFRGRSALLGAMAARGACLPPTVSHGDLHPWNVAIRPDGEVVFFDWDEVAAGPAGLCLHGLFDGSTRAVMLLDRMARGEAVPENWLSARLDAYVDALVEGGYATRAAVLRGLPGALCAGQLRFIASFGRYPGEAQLEAAATTIRTKLSDLLDLCDWLASRDEAAARASIDDYERSRDWRRAHRLVQDLLSRGVQDALMLARYGTLSFRLGDLDTAQEAFDEALSLDPDQVDARIGQARMAMVRLDFDAAAAGLQAALSRQPDHPVAAALAQRVGDMQAAAASAERPEALPRWAVSDEERTAGELAPDTQALVAEMFRRYGVVQLDAVFPPERIARMQAAFAERNATHFHDGEHPDALQVGDKRIMLTMELDDTFGAPDVVASGLLMPVMHRLLGKECILGAYTAVVSLPGSADQRIHKDHSELFEESGWQLDHPSFCAQVIIPLLALDETTGATRMFKASQRVPLRKCADLPAQDPVVPLGSCVLLDYSVAHLGRGNRSDQVRPILNLIYSRPWFRDCRNYHLQPPLKFAPGYFEGASETIRSLVGWWDLECRTAAQARPDR